MQKDRKKQKMIVKIKKKIKENIKNKFERNLRNILKELKGLNKESRDFEEDYLRNM